MGRVFLNLNIPFPLYPICCLTFYESTSVRILYKIVYLDIMCPKSYPNPKYYNCIEKNGDAQRMYKEGASSNSRFLFLICRSF